MRCLFQTKYYYELITNSFEVTLLIPQIGGHMFIPEQVMKWVPKRGHFPKIPGRYHGESLSNNSIHTEMHVFFKLK